MSGGGRRWILWACVACLVGISGCDSDSGGGDSGGGGAGQGGDVGGAGNPGGAGSPGGGAPISGVAQAVRGFATQDDSEAVHEEGVAIGVEATVAASVLGANGERLITTGTLTQEGQSFRYAPEPDDRLVVALDGLTLTYQIRRLEGDFNQETVDDFLSKAHVVDLSVEADDGRVNATLQSALSGSEELRLVQGTFRGSDGVTYTADLRYEGQRDADVDVSSAAYEADRLVTGTITAEGFSLESRWEESYTAVLFDNYVENRTRTMASRWTVGGQTYTTEGVLLRTAHSNTRPTDYEFWRGEGRVMRDGAVVAELGLRQAANRWEIFLQTAEGEEILETYPIGNQ